MTTDAASGLATIDTILFFAFIVELTRISRIAASLKEPKVTRAVVYSNVALCVIFVTAVGFLIAILDGATDWNVVFVAWSASGLFFLFTLTMFVWILLTPRVSEPLIRLVPAPVRKRAAKRLSPSASLHPARPSRAARRRR